MENFSQRYKGTDTLNAEKETHITPSPMAEEKPKKSMLTRPGTVAKCPLCVINYPGRKLLTPGDKYAPIQEWFVVSRKTPNLGRLHSI